MQKIDGDALKAIITSWIARTTHGEQTILSESIRETLRGVSKYPTYTSCAALPPTC